MRMIPVERMASSPPGMGQHPEAVNRGLVSTHRPGEDMAFPEGQGCIERATTQDPDLQSVETTASL